ncbi:FecR family protein [Niabella aquatica]
MISKRAIQHFLKGPLKPEESEAIARYLKENPDALSFLINEEEWKAYVSDYDKREHHIDVNRSYEPSVLIRGSKRKQGSIVKLTISVAASIIIALGVWLFFYSQKDKTVNRNYEVYVNTSTDSLQFFLEDSTRVHLASYSSLRFEITEKNERLATLDGGAFFAVKKDSLRKFIVKAQEIHSTVLGTSFSVQAGKLDSMIQVNLYTGRLAVQYISDSIYKEKYILHPGDVYYYSKHTKQEKVVRYQAPKKIGKPDVKGSGKKEAADIRVLKNQWYMFNNQPLNEVFDQLSNIYGVPISYSSGDLSGLTFIGKIDKTDTLEQVLEYLSRLNGLKLSKEGTRYFIRK